LCARWTGLFDSGAERGIFFGKLFAKQLLEYMHASIKAVGCWETGDSCEHVRSQSPTTCFRCWRLGSTLCPRHRAWGTTAYRTPGSDLIRSVNSGLQFVSGISLMQEPFQSTYRGVHGGDIVEGRHNPSDSANVWCSNPDTKSGC